MDRRLIFWPNLYGFLRFLLYQLKFAAFLAGIVVVAMLVAFVCFWRQTVSPPGFEPVIRIRWIDRLQAESLRRTATRLTLAGDHEKAAFTWRMAIHHHPANMSLVRAALATQYWRDPTPATIGETQRLALWLLRCGGTNRQHVALVSRVLDRADESEMLIQLVDGQLHGASVETLENYVRALFRLGRFEELPRVAERFRARFDNSAALETAALAASVLKANGLGEASDEDRLVQDIYSRVKAAPRTSPHRAWLLELGMAVCRHRRDLATSRIWFQELEALGRVRWRDRIAFWDLLAFMEGEERLRVQFERIGTMPDLGEDALALSRVLKSVGMVDEATEVEAHGLRQDGSCERLWLEHANSLMRSRRWDALQALALDYRLRVGRNSALEPFSHYWEGLAGWHQQRRAEAERHFARIGDYPPVYPKLALQVVHHLRALDQDEAAYRLLRALEPEYGGDAVFWLTISECAMDEGDAEGMLQAASRAYSIDPESLPCRNNYAVALLVHRRRPLEALRLTESLMNGQSVPPFVRLNHALALLQNRRIGEASGLLSGLANSIREDPAIRSSWLLAHFELAFLEERFGEAWILARGIEPGSLLPITEKWIREQVEKIPELWRGEVWSDDSVLSAQGWQE